MKWWSNKGSREFEEMEESRMIKRRGKGMHMGKKCMGKRNTGKECMGK